MTRRLPTIALLLILAACAPFNLIESEPQTIAGAYTILPERNWTRFRPGGLVSAREYWTIDGPNLERLDFYSAVADGDPLLNVGDEERRPRFRATMRASEVAELVVDSLTQAGAQEVAARNLRPADFGGEPGFRFELSFANRSGLFYEGMAAGMIREGQLYLVLFTGTRIHYFPQLRDEVERMFNSIRLISGATPA